MHSELTRLPSLVALRAFVVLGETRNMRRAGEILRTDHASISRHIAGLEAFLRVSLIEKGARGISLTAAGEAYHRRLSRAFDGICEATAALRPAAPRLLAIHVTPGLAHETLLPALPALSQLLGDVRINFITSVDGRVGVASSSEIPLQIRFGALANPPAKHLQVPLCSPRLFPVASPGFLARYPPVNSIEDMLRLPMLYSDEAGVWTQWADKAGAQRLDRSKGTEMPNTHLALQAATLGQGVALANSVLARRALERGELVEVLDTSIRIDAYYLICSREHWDEEPVRAVRRWLETVLVEAPT